MSKLEDLVPPPELCKLIPEGDFLDAAFAWHLTDIVGFVCGNGCKQVSGKQWQLVQSNASRIIRARKRGEQIYPAPTLQEIMSELSPGDTACFCCYHGDSQWSMGDCERDLYVKNGTENSNPATAALKLWLKLKGVEDGE